jgi:hypothetical protein
MVIAWQIWACESATDPIAFAGMRTTAAGGANGFKKFTYDSGVNATKPLGCKGF